jgi:WD40 repeat protein
VVTKIINFPPSHEFTPKLEVADGPFCSSISSDGTTVVFGYGTKVEIWNIPTLEIVYTTSPISAWSVSINSDGTVLAVGSSDSKIYIYKKLDTWTWVLDSMPETGASGFGYSISINSNGDTLLVGKQVVSGGSTDTGVVSVYKSYNTVWEETGSLTFPSSVYSVSISGDGTTYVFGLPHENGYTGCVYITKDEGTTFDILEGEHEEDWFGYYVSSNYDGTRIVANSSVGIVGGDNYIKIFTLE